MKKIVFVSMLAVAMLGCASEQPNVAASAPAAPQDRKPAPDFELDNVAGGKMKSTEFKGKVAVIDFWATWCAPCIQEIPHFNTLHETHDGQNVQMLAITVESGSLAEIKPKVTQFEMKYPVLVGNDDVVAGFGGLIGFPTTYVLDKDWKVYKRYLGMTVNKKELIEKDIETLLAEQSSF
jgi:thiol-disulfide isomerase/thioredoxin